METQLLSLLCEHVENEGSRTIDVLLFYWCVLQVKQPGSSWVFYFIFLSANVCVTILNVALNCSATTWKRPTCLTTGCVTFAVGTWIALEMILVFTIMWEIVKVTLKKKKQTPFWSESDRAARGQSVPWKQTHLKYKTVDFWVTAGRPALILIVCRPF